MIKTSAFYDLCIQQSFFSQDNLEKSIKSLYQLGYRTIAVNQTIEDINIEQSKKKKKKGGSKENQDIVPVPYNLSAIQDVIKKLDIDNFHVFNRLTVIFANQDGLHKITKSPNFKKYHIFAVSPTTNQALLYTCSTLEADIFAYNPEIKFDLRLNRKLYTQLMERSYYFELLYSPAIEDSSQRKHLIHASHLYHSYGKSKNIIFSSGANRPALIRNPYDVINMGFLFGLSELQCKTAVSHCPSKVILNSVGRRLGKSVMFVEHVTSTMEVVEISSNDDEEEEIDTEEPKQKKTKT
ncbi:ribonuclease P protein subunit p30 [Diorhabda sublineata]|uniref:ribonuclease P protein subunit p30 n=1 Tax=Diorhabda sublineata TaxID=1163346 RepID=UPI0024E0A018|nr:ribonuclease P protein subunit p30 [Diorhabda sublineata]